MAFKHKKRAFSLVELMMLLLVSSLIIAALVPVVTKKHFRLPSPVIHGAYMCYYKNGELYEAKWSGKNQQTVVYDRPTDQCVFSPPQKAAYFQISAIGGGGGGGDAGYTGGDPFGGWSSPKKLSPWGITEEALEPLNISKQGFLDNAGELWGNAKSGSSGSGGSIGWATKEHYADDCLEWSYKDEVQPCSEWSTASDTFEITECYEKTEEPAEGEGTGESTETTSYNSNIFTRIATKFANFFTNTIALKPFEKGKIIGAADKVDVACKLVYHIPHTTCPTERVCHSTCTGWTNPSSECRKTEEKCTDPVETTREECTPVEVKTPGRQVICRDGQSFCSTTPTTSRDCTSSGAACDIISYDEECHDVPYTEPPVCHTECVDWYTPPAESYEYACDCETVQLPCTTTTEDDVIVDNCEGEVECTTRTANEGETFCLHQDIIPVKDQCINEVPLFRYNVTVNSGESGASGASCSGPSVSGGFKMSNKSFSNSYNGSNGKDSDLTSINAYFGTKNTWAEDGMAPCATAPDANGNYTTYEAQDCGSDVSYSQYDILKDNNVVSSIIAYSASRGGGGAGRTCTDNTEGECVDSPLSATKTSLPGSCSGDYGTTDCGTGGLGYCLKHVDGVIEPNGQYNYNYSYDHNYLNYGEPGSPGQFKTVLVRSLKDVDTTIKIGRGGSAAAFNLGQAGAKGSPTSMGSIIFADGGEGGRGGISKTGEVLPKFDNDLYGLEEECYALTGDIPEHCHGIDYTFHIVSGRTFGKEPTPVGFASTIMTFIFNTADNSQAIQKFVKSGRGGAGGGVEHRCWAGRFEVNFEGRMMLDTSVFASKADAEAYGATAAVAEKRYVPEACRDDWDNVPAGPGSDGALLIKW